MSSSTDSESASGDRETAVATADSIRFEEVSLTGGERRWLSFLQPVCAGLTFLLLVGVGVFAVYQEQEVITLAGRKLEAITWMYVVAILFVGVVFLPKLVGSPGRVRRLLGRLRGRPLVAVGGLYALVLFLVATLYPVFASEPTFDVLDSLQPPAWSSVSETFPPQCVGPVENGQCQGTLEHPLGTNGEGQDQLTIGLLGLNTSIRVALTASVLSVTLGVVVGTVAGYRGGRIDEVLMRYVDIQRALPAFFAYMLLTLVFGVSYRLLILVFGLLSWGGIARLVRSEVAQLRTTPYINAAELSGADSAFVLLRHIVPNAANTIVTAASLLFAKFVVYEAALAFLSLTDPQFISLGNQLRAAIGGRAATFDGASRPLFDFWFVPWVVYVPAGIICSFLLTVSTLGDGLRDVIDPRER
jgi:peptide/nickel transport system permease protein